MTYTLACDAGAYVVTGQAARRGATAFCSISATAIWFPVAPGVSSLPAAPAEVVNPSPVAANQATVPSDWDDDAPDLCYLFQDILPVGQPPLFPTEQTVAYVHLPFLETVEAVGITKARLVVGEFPYSLTLPGEAVTLRTRARLSVIVGTLDAEAGAVALTGQDADLRVILTLQADPVAVAVLGEDVNLRSGPATYELACDGGSYVMTGQEAGPYILAAEPGAVEVLGVDLKPRVLLTANAGAYTTTGYDAVMTVTTPPPPPLLLLHMEGTGTTIVDSSSSPKTITLGTGDVQDITQSTTQKKFGDKSLYFPSGWSYMEASGLGLSSGDPFTLELFFWLSDDAATFGTTFICGTGVSLTDTNYNSDDGLKIGSSTAIGMLDTETWHYLKITRSTSNVIRRFLNGTEYYTGSTYTDSGTLGTLTLGTDNVFDDSISMKGYIDEVRIRPEADNSLTVPTEAFPDP